MIGVCSYLLIGYYSHRLAAVKSAQKAILVNRVSDGMLLWGVLWIWYYTGCLEYDLVLLNETSSISMFIVISVLIGAMGKSAQILFHVWLADAMEGLIFIIYMVIAFTIETQSQALAQSLAQSQSLAQALAQSPHYYDVYPETELIIFF